MVASKALDGPDNASWIQVERNPVSPRVKGSAVYVGDGSDGATVGLLLLKHCIKIIYIAGIAQCVRKGREELSTEPGRIG